MKHPTALHAFFDSLQANPSGLAIRIVERSGIAVELSYAELFSLIRRAVQGLNRSGVKSGDRLVLGLPTCPEFFAVYLGALWCRAIPLVAHLPRFTSENGYGNSPLDHLVAQSQANLLVVQASSLAIGGPRGSVKVVAAEELLDFGEIGEIELNVKADDIAHLQPTSGSTGSQKIAVVRHRNIVANIGGIATAIGVHAKDSLAFWLPLFHDMGLIAVSCSLYWQVPMTVTDPSNFIRNPVRFWLRIISEYKATITAAPNSAYEACARLAALRRFEGLDLASCRAAFWGAEPIHRETLERFESAFAEYGYKRNATLPVYGLAEATLAVTVSDVDKPPKILQVNSDILEVGRVEQSKDTRKIDVVSVGKPLASHEVRVVNSRREALKDRCVGEIEVAGPSIVDTYYGSKSKLLTQGADYLATGDLGYFDQGELYILGREKEIIIVKGRNFIPAELEAFTEGIVQRRLHKGVAAVGVQDSFSRSETVHLLIETRVFPVPPDLEDKLRNGLADSFGLVGVRIHWVPKGKVPKTTSGKIKRFRCRELALALDSEASASVASRDKPVERREFPDLTP